MTQKVTAWSYSRWSEYEKCPALTRFKVIEKRKEPGSAAMDRGTLIHGKIEHYLLNGGRQPKEVHKDLNKYYKDLKAAKPKVELQLCFDIKWNMVDWFGSTAWCRVKVDALVPPAADGTVRIVDHKTGKLKEYTEYENQLEIYGLAGLLTVPEAKSAKAELVFTDAGKVMPAVETIPAAALPKLKKKWEAKVKPMLSDTVFAPRPGRYCHFCHFRKSNGGPCVY